MKEAQPFRRNEIYQAFFENSADAIFVLDADLRVLDANQAACDRLGYTRDELLSISAVEINAPESRPLLMHNAELLRTTGSARGEVIHITKHGGRIPVEINSRQISLAGKNLILTVARDISDRKAVENRLLQSQQHFQLLFENTGTANSFYDLQGRLVLCNQLGSRLLGYEDPQELVGKSFQEIFGKKQGDVFQQRLTKAATERETQIYVTEFLRDSNEVWVQSWYVPLIAAGQVIGVQLVSQDVSEQKRYEKYLNSAKNTLEDQVAERTRHLEQVLTQLQEAQVSIVGNEKLAVLGRLSASVAHEVNSPLAAIQSSNGTIKNSFDSILANLFRVFSLLSEDARGQFLELLRQSELSLRETISTGLRSERLKLARKLAEQKVAEVENVTDSILQLGLQNTDAGWLPLLFIEHRDEVLEIATQIANLYRSTHIIATATGKATEFIKAMRRFAHKDHSHDEPEPLDLVGNLETVLLLLKSQFQGVELVRDYQSRPTVLGLPNLLLQVWTNLIQNALQAMEGGGTLTIGIKIVSNRAVVEITDTGKGIPEYLREKIFEPFFTTKSSEKGTGLGLGIAMEALTQNHGSLEFNSIPGKTTFQASLPLEKP